MIKLGCIYRGGLSSKATKAKLTSSQQAGFTLVETLIALFIFSLIAAGTFGTLATTLQTQSRLETFEKDMSNMASARALVKSDMMHLTLRPVRGPYGQVDTYMLSSGLTTLLSFTRAGRLNPGGLEPRGDIQRVSYVLEEGQLIRRVLLQSNPVPQTVTRDQVLFDNVDQVHLIFADDRRNYDRLAIPSLPAPGEVRPEVNMMVLDIRFDDGQRLIQKFEMDL